MMIDLFIDELFLLIKIIRLEARIFNETDLHCLTLQKPALEILRFTSPFKLWQEGNFFI